MKGIQHLSGEMHRMVTTFVIQQAPTLRCLGRLLLLPFFRSRTNLPKVSECSFSLQRKELLS